jgi:DNA-binding Xre family transcriptional regulator
MDELFAFVRKGVEDRKGKWPELAKSAGVSYSWLSKLGAGKYDNTNVGHRSLERVAAALRQQP